MATLHRIPQVKEGEYPCGKCDLNSKRDSTARTYCGECSLYKAYASNGRYIDPAYRWDGLAWKKPLEKLCLCGSPFFKEADELVTCVCCGTPYSLEAYEQLHEYPAVNIAVDGNGSK